MWRTVLILLMISFVPLLGLDCGIAIAAGTCNQTQITWSVTSKPSQSANSKQLAKQGSLPNYIAAIKAISSSNNDVMATFIKRAQALGLRPDNAGYLALKSRDPGFINVLALKQRDIDQQLLDSIARHGLPVAEKVGLNGMMSSAMIMVNTFDPASADKFAALWKNGCEKGELPCAAYALIEDNALLLRDGVQRFGTNVGVPFAKGTSLMQVNEERAKIGLGPLSQTCMDDIAKPHP